MITRYANDRHEARFLASLSEGDVIWRHIKTGNVLGAQWGRVFRSTQQEPVATDKSKAMRLVASIRGRK